MPERKFYKKTTRQVPPDYALIIHPVTEELLFHYEPGMKNKPKKIIRKLLEWIKPFKASEVDVLRSKDGKEIRGCLVMCTLLFEQMVQLEPQFVLKKIVNAGRFAKDLGAKIIGLGAYAALIGNCGRVVENQLKLPVTTGSSYTVATFAQGVKKAASLMNISLKESKMTILGATSAIGRYCAAFFSPLVERLELYTKNLPKLDNLLLELSAYKRKIRKSDNPEKSIRHSDIVIVTGRGTSFDPGSLQPNSLICDATYPRTIPLEMKKRDDIFVMESVAVSVPHEVRFNFYFGLPPGLAYPCMAEPMILALEDRFESFSLGRKIDHSKVREISELAEKHNFKMAELISFGKVVPDEEVKKLSRN